MKSLKNCKYSAVLVFLVLSAVIGCKEDLRKPLNAGGIPEPVSDVKVENLAGSSEIYYSVGDDKTMYILGEYEIRPGVKRQSKSSIFNNKIVVDGFPKEGDYEVTMYAVGTGEERSAPVKVKVSPKEPPLLVAFGTLNLSAGFGGVVVTCKNVEEGDLSVHVITKASNGSWATPKIEYTKRQDIKFAVRGYEPEDKLFGAYIEDRWGNTSDTTFSTIKPLFEKNLDRVNFREFTLPTDVLAREWSGRKRALNFLWDGIIGASTNNVFASEQVGMPVSFTMDLGAVTKLSRYRFWDRQDWALVSGSPKKWEIWGSVNPGLDGSWDSWTKLGDFESVRPSGGTIADPLTAEDKAYAVAGEEHEFMIDVPPVRYLRFRMLEVWQSSLREVQIAEISFWGANQ